MSKHLDMTPRLASNDVTDGRSTHVELSANFFLRHTSRVKSAHFQNLLIGNPCEPAGGSMIALSSQLAESMKLIVRVGSPFEISKLISTAISVLVVCFVSRSWFGANKCHQNKDVHGKFFFRAFFEKCYAHITASGFFETANSLDSIRPSISPRTDALNSANIANFVEF